MRNKQWTTEQNDEATVRAYKIAVKDGAVNLAHNIVKANPQIDWSAIDAKLVIDQAQTEANIAKDNLELLNQ
jgi:hypothetical protein